jgi:hypothetical protein
LSVFVVTSNLQAVACSSSEDASGLDLDLEGGLRSDLLEEAEIDLGGHAPEGYRVLYASETPAEGLAAPVEAVRTSRILSYFSVLLYVLI